MCVRAAAPSTACADAQTTDEKLDCLIALNQPQLVRTCTALNTRVLCAVNVTRCCHSRSTMSGICRHFNQPKPALPIDAWPGNAACISCRFFWASLVCVADVAILLLLAKLFAKPSRAARAVAVRPPRGAAPSAAAPSPAAGTAPAPVGTSPAWPAWTAVLAVVLFAYWLFVFAVFTNFIAWAVLLAPVAVAPSVVALWGDSTQRSRRLQVAAMLCGVLTLALFPNVTVMPAQLPRHIWKSELLLTPSDPGVLALRDQFYADVLPQQQFQELAFPERMLLVDKFIYAEVPWVESFSLYGVVGLLVTPADVFAHHGGDCQGQAVVTCSMLLAMGTRCAVVETPFHWWTHAYDGATGQEASLNYHGHGGNQGSVTPQPVDLAVTWWPPRCDPAHDPDCTYPNEHNTNTVVYERPPLSALANAWTGMHEFRRDVVPPLVRNPAVLVVIVGVLCVLCGLFGAGMQNDGPWAPAPSVGTAVPKAWAATLTRCLAALPAALLAVVGLVFWALVWYPATLMHLLACAGTGLYLASVATVPPPTPAHRPAAAGYAVPSEHHRHPAVVAI